MVCYDITDPKRLRKIYKLMKGFGKAMQYSVFQCNLTPIKLQMLLRRIEETIEKHEDRVMIVDLGPFDGRWEERVQIIGQSLSRLDEDILVF